MEPARHEGFADSGGVKIHYVTQGEGPLVVMIHGFPDFWYTWRDQMPALARHFQVAAIDQRGYNLSDQPRGVDNYSADKLVEDVRAVVNHFRKDRAVIVGHDWGGFVAWIFAMTYPDLTDRLVVVNLPHPQSFRREYAQNPGQFQASQYARDFQKPGAEALLSPELLAAWVNEPEAIPHYREALGRSSIEGMLNFYRANFPREPVVEVPPMPPVKCPVLLIHGLDDPYILPGALNDTWKWVQNDLTLVTILGAGHWVHRDARDFVTGTMESWLTQPTRPRRVGG